MEYVRFILDNAFYNLFFGVATVAVICLLFGIALTYFAPAALNRFRSLIWGSGIVCGLAAIVCYILIMSGWQK